MACPIILAGGLTSMSSCIFFYVGVEPGALCLDANSFYGALAEKQNAAQRQGPMRAEIPSPPVSQQLSVERSDYCPSPSDYRYSYLTIITTHAWLLSRLNLTH